MSEEEIKVTKEEELKLVRIELGSEYSCKIHAKVKNEKKDDEINFTFSVHIPTMNEELKISVKEQEILGVLSLNSLTNSAVKMIATLDIVCDEIVINNKKYESTFWEMVRNIRQVGLFYKEVIFPVYSELIKFQNSAEMDFEDLKKSLASLGKK